ncbi:hypothetical protein [Terribacillus sp. FSL K6-0262]|uniref:hypothetical protein n=1 Tax=Terribacillus TaxID=459532 RepID=UPI0030EB71C4
MTMEGCLKSIQGRKLRSGDWIVVARDADPLVVNEELAKSLIYNNSSLKDYDEEIANILKDNDFCNSSSDKIKSLPDEENNLKWNIKRMFLFIMGGLSILSVVILTLFNGVPNGSILINNSISLPLNISLLIGFALITTLIHELMHIIFARSYKLRTGGLRLNILQANATVSMTHIWVWSFFPRLAALSAGLIFDFFLLSCLLIFNIFITDWMLAAAISILWLRIAWQFRFHKNCDGHFIVLSLLDNPMLAVDEGNSNVANVRTWSILKKVGYVVNLILIAYWFLPFLWMLFSNVYFNFFE